MKGTIMAEPKRLLAVSQDPALTQALRAARSQLGTPEHVRALREKLAVRLAAPQAGAAAAPKAALAGGAKVWIVLAAAVAALIGLRQQFSSEPEPPAAPVQPQVAMATREAPVKSSSPAAARALTDTEITPVVLPSMPAQRPRRARGTRVQSNSATAPRVEVDTDAEVALISSAQQALERDPRRALAALDEHARRFARGVLAEEREVLRFDALVALGRIDEARVRARAFVSSFPKSAQRPRLQHWLDARREATLVRNPGAEPTPTDRVRNTEEVE
jgi:hypothetical protein